MVGLWDTKLFFAITILVSFSSRDINNKLTIIAYSLEADMILSIIFICSRSSNTVIIFNLLVIGRLSFIHLINLLIRTYLLLLVENLLAIKYSFKYSACILLISSSVICEIILLLDSLLALISEGSSIERLLLRVPSYSLYL